MASDRISVSFQKDPDFREVAEMVTALIRDAYDRGAISWSRRMEMLNDPSGLVECGTYSVPSDTPSELRFGIFIEPSAAFLAEIDAGSDISGWC